MVPILYSIVSFIVALGILIAVHEYGHYWMARRMGVKVLRFAIGFGKPLWSATRGPDNTEYIIGMLPLGGYVKMLDEREGPVQEKEVHRAFNRQPVWPRIAIVSAGPLANFLFAIVVYWGIFMIGLPGMKAIVERVDIDSLAARAEFRSGDEIVQVSGHDTATLEAVRLSLVKAALNREIVDVVVKREGAPTELRIALDKVEMKDIEKGLLSEIGIVLKQPVLPAIIGHLEAGGVAERAGLREGDQILRVDQQAIADWIAWAEYVRAHPGQMLQVTVKREDAELMLPVTPAMVTANGKSFGRIGAAPRVMDELPNELAAVQKYGVVEALGRGIVKTWDTSWLTLQMLGKMIVGEASIENLSGPISIAQYAGQSARIGILPFFAFLAIISISLGVLNLLPVPVLDGGHLVFYGVEAIKGSPVPENILLLGQKFGVLLLIALMILAFYNDIARILG